jgi:phosphate:Na+ symporter
MFYIVVFTCIALFVINPDLQTILGGVALFFLGTIILEDGIKGFGPKIESVLKTATKSKTKAITTGFLSTAVIQSSSLVSILTLGFVSAGIMSLASGIGVVFGSNLGTTATAWLVSAFGLKIKVAHYALGILLFGMLARYFKHKNLSEILIGLALLFLAIGFMKDGFESIDINLSLYIVDGVLGIFIFVGLGALITVVLQSSSATVALILTAISTSQITYESALLLAIGANIGTTITAILASLVSTINGKKLAVAHLIFNIITAFITILFLDFLIIFVDYLANFISINDLAMKISLFHTVFNLLGIIIVSPFIGILVKFLDKYIKCKNCFDDAIKPKYINDNIMNSSEASIMAIRKEIENMYEISLEIFAHGINLHREEIHSEVRIKELIKERRDIELQSQLIYKNKIKIIYDEIINFCSKVSLNASEEDLLKINELTFSSRKIVSAIKKMHELEKNISVYGFSKNEYIKLEYDYIRKKLGSLFRHIEKLRENPNTPHSIKKIKRIKDAIKYNDKIMNRKLDELIRSEKITTSMATSLMNDSVFVSGISSDIIKVIEILFFEYDTKTKKEKIKENSDEDI